MFMIITHPWPVPSANAALAEFATGEAVTKPPGATEEPGWIRPSRVEDLVSWTCRERLRLLWYRFRLATCGIGRPSRQAGVRRLKVR